MQVIEELIDELTPGGIDRERLSEAREAIHLSVWVVSFDEPVGVEQQAVARSHGPHCLLVLHAR